MLVMAPGLVFINPGGFLLSLMVPGWFKSDLSAAGAKQGCISCGMCSYPELTKDHVLTSAYVNIFRTVTRNAVNKSV